MIDIAGHTIFNRGFPFYIDLLHESRYDVASVRTENDRSGRGRGDGEMVSEDWNPMISVHERRGEIEDEIEREATAFRVEPLIAIEANPC